MTAGARGTPKGEYGQSWEIAAALLDGPKTVAEIVEHFHGYARLVGFFGVTQRMARRHDRMAGRIEAALAELVARGWVVLLPGDQYELTPAGYDEGGKVLMDMRRARALLDRVTQQQTVSKVGLVVHLALAALKMPAALLSGSVGLFNDAADTLLDGLSSLLVTVGLRFDRERAVNVVLVLVMLVTGAFTFYEAVFRFFQPVVPETDWFTFAATLVSALVCLMLGLYQRYVGTRSGSMALITQSVDSRNHVITAAGVTAGLTAAFLRFPLLDTLVGLVVALLILQSAVELAIELIRTLGDHEVDLSRYDMRLIARYEGFKQAQLGDWMLYLIDREGIETRADLAARARAALDWTGNPTLRALGAGQTQDADDPIAPSLKALVDRGWVAEDGCLRLTALGREHLRKQMRESFPHSAGAGVSPSSAARTRTR